MRFSNFSCTIMSLWCLFYSALQESLKQSKHRLRQFQQYIGATDLPSDSKGLNVHQEKTALQQKVQVIHFV